MCIWVGLSIIIFAIPFIDARSTETIHVSVERCKNAANVRKKERVISHLAAASPWNELDLTLKNNEI